MGCFESLTKSFHLPSVVDIMHKVISRKFSQTCKFITSVLHSTFSVNRFKHEISLFSNVIKKAECGKPNSCGQNTHKGEPEPLNCNVPVVDVHGDSISFVLITHATASQSTVIDEEIIKINHFK